MSDHEEIDERPSKRPRLDDSISGLAPIAESATEPAPVTLPSIAPAKNYDSEFERELRAGITEYVCPDNLGFTGVLKQRYTDFLVNEILPNGEVLHLKSIGLPNKGDKPRVLSGTNGTKDEPKRNEEDAPTKEDEEPVEAKPVAEEDKMEVDQDTEMMHADRAKQISDAQSSGSAGAEADEGDNISESDVRDLVEIFGEDVTVALRALARKIKSHVNRKAKDFKAIDGPVITDKQQRTEAHQTLRRVFPNLFESSMNPDHSIHIKATPPSQRGSKKKNKNERGDQAPDRHRGQLGWEELGGEYLHFSLYKENKDTMEVVGFLGSMCGGSKSFGFAGTKDRRACTVQRVSVKRQVKERMAHLNKKLYNGVIGDFEYKSHDIRLGGLMGNEFCITLRDCHFQQEDCLDHDRRVEHAEKALSKAVLDFSEKGFINYYGLQRFGSFAASTDAIGIKLLQEDFKWAVKSIIDYSKDALAAAEQTEDNPTLLISQDDKLRAKGLHLWRTCQRAGDALDIIPRKFTAERNIIQHLGSRNQKTKRYDRITDWQGALMTIPRNLRLMYVHAYQSLVWNVVAGKRWNLYGDKVVEGDLVLVNEHKDKEPKKEEKPQSTIDQDGEIIINPSGEDSAFEDDNQFERARALTKAEAESGLYNIFDVVLPQPGFDVEYPKNAIGDFYKEFMGSERGGGLDPHNMRRKWREISLSGGYRKFLARPLQKMSHEVLEYTRPDQQLVETDLQRVKRAMGEEVELDGGNGEGGEGEKKIAVVLRLQLASSQYATMALRELMKAGGVKAFKPEYMGGR